MSFERRLAPDQVVGVLERGSVTTGVLLTIGFALATSAAPACGPDACDPNDKAYCDDDTVYVCQRDCRMRGSVDETCTDEWHWSDRDCAETGSTCVEKGGQAHCER